MNIRIGDALPDIIKSLESIIWQYGNTSDIQKLHSLAKIKNNTALQFARKIKAIVIKILCKIDYFMQDTHFIDQNILSQNTYHKTLTSRP